MTLCGQQARPITVLFKHRNQNVIRSNAGVIGSTEYECTARPSRGFVGEATMTASIIALLILAFASSRPPSARGLSGIRRTDRRPWEAGPSFRALENGKPAVANSTPEPKYGRK